LRVPTTTTSELTLAAWLVKRGAQLASEATARHPVPDDVAACVVQNAAVGATGVAGGSSRRTRGRTLSTGLALRDDSRPRHYRRMSESGRGEHNP
jgi:hypothetical protein